jgi:hypothetical protein
MVGAFLQQQQHQEQRQQRDHSRTKDWHCVELNSDLVEKEVNIDYLNRLSSP